MTDSTNLRTLIRLCILSILSICLWLFSGTDSHTTTQVGDQINVTINQPKSESGIPPIEIRCEAARLLNPNELAGFSCWMKNNTNKNITAADLVYAVLLDTDGVSGKDSHSLTIETLIHPDFHQINRPIAPNTEQSVGRIAKNSYDSALIKGVEIGVDYVEFEDGTKLGPDEEGSRIIAGLREGANKYKKWLAQEYIKRGRPANPCSSLLQSDQPLPDLSGELTFKDSNEKNGARGYQGRLRKICSVQGPAEVKKYLPK